jgi:hypothetical protein
MSKDFKSLPGYQGYVAQGTSIHGGMFLATQQIAALEPEIIKEKQAIECVDAQISALAEEKKRLLGTKTGSGVTLPGVHVREALVTSANNYAGYQFSKYSPVTRSHMEERCKIMAGMFFDSLNNRDGIYVVPDDAVIQACGFTGGDVATRKKQFLKFFKTTFVVTIVPEMLNDSLYAPSATQLRLGKKEREILLKNISDLKENSLIAKTYKSHLSKVEETELPEGKQAPKAFFSGVSTDTKLKPKLTGMQLQHAELKKGGKEYDEQYEYIQGLNGGGFNIISATALSSMETLIETKTSADPNFSVDYTGAAGANRNLSTVRNAGTQQNVDARAQIEQNAYNFTPVAKNDPEYLNYEKNGDVSVKLESDASIVAASNLAKQARMDQAVAKVLDEIPSTAVTKVNGVDTVVAIDEKVKKLETEKSKHKTELVKLETSEQDNLKKLSNVTRVMGTTLGAANAKTLEATSKVLEAENNQYVGPNNTDDLKVLRVHLKRLTDLLALDPSARTATYEGDLALARREVAKYQSDEAKKAVLAAGLEQYGVSDVSGLPHLKPKEQEAAQDRLKADRKSRDYEEKRLAHLKTLKTTAVAAKSTSSSPSTAQQVAETVVGAVGGVTGAVVGGVAGAIGGALAGTKVEDSGLGTVAGSTLGGAAGAVGGGYTGAKAGSALVQAGFNLANGSSSSSTAPVIANNDVIVAASKKTNGFDSNTDRILVNVNVNLDRHRDSQASSDKADITLDNSFLVDMEDTGQFFEDTPAGNEKARNKFISTLVYDNDTAHKDWFAKPTEDLDLGFDEPNKMMKVKYDNGDGKLTTKLNAGGKDLRTPIKDTAKDTTEQFIYIVFVSNSKTPVADEFKGSGGVYWATINNKTGKIVGEPQGLKDEAEAAAVAAIQLEIMAASTKDVNKLRYTAKDAKDGQLVTAVKSNDVFKYVETTPMPSLTPPPPTPTATAAKKPDPFNFGLNRIFGKNP